MTVECPTCGGDYDSERAMKSHHTLAHGESLVPTTACDHCGEEFQPRADNAGRFCSAACSNTHRRDRVALTCEHCGDTYKAQPSEADRRTHCSQDCYYKSKQTVDIRNCAECGDVFETVPSDTQTFCSEGCANKARRNRETRACAVCDEEFTVQASSDKTYCTVSCANRDRAEYREFECAGCGQPLTRRVDNKSDYCCEPCRYESVCKRDLPAHPALALWALYEVEDRPIDEVYKRQRTHFGFENRLTRAEVKGLLEQMEVYDGQTKTHHDLLDADPDEILGDLPGGKRGETA